MPPLRDHLLRRVPTDPIRLTGVIVMALATLGLVLGLVLVGLLTGMLRTSIEVSRPAVTAVGSTIDAIDAATDEASRNIAAASDAVDGTAATVDGAITAIETVAVFLEDDLSSDIVSLRRAMPAAVQAADAVDGTLRALSLFGVDYDPDEPLGDALRDVDAALEGLPERLRGQSDALRSVVGPATELSRAATRLASTLDSLAGDLAAIQRLTERYRSTLEQAQTTIDIAESSLGAQAWLARAVVLMAAAAGFGAGWGIFRLGEAVDRVAAALEP